MPRVPKGEKNSHRAIPPGATLTGGKRLLQKGERRKRKCPSAAGVGADGGWASRAADSARAGLWELAAVQAGARGTGGRRLFGRAVPTAPPCPRSRPIRGAPPRGPAASPMRGALPRPAPASRPIRGVLAPPPRPCSPALGGSPRCSREPRAAVPTVPPSPRLGCGSDPPSFEESPGCL